jgi:hypothetical protein
LIRASAYADCRGWTHEYWDVKGLKASSKGAWVLDHCDGSNRPEKLERDLELLGKQLEEYPADGRTCFYLAQTLQDLGRYEEAIHYYEERIRGGGWEEECWMAQYRIGQCLQRMGLHTDAAQAYELADARRPWRPEPLLALGMMMIDGGYPQVALATADRLNEAQRIAPLRREPDRLFLEHRGRYARDLLQAAACHHVGQWSRGEASCHALLSNPALAPGDVGYVLELQSHYLKPLPSTQVGTYNYGTDKRWSTCNPTIAPDGQVGIRLVNYDANHGKSYVSRDSDTVIRSRFVLGGTEVNASKWFNPCARIQGLEDIRFAAEQYGGCAVFTATTCEVPGAGGKPQVVIGTMDLATKRIVQLRPILYSSRKDVEKNWVPWMTTESRALVVYSWNPFLLLQVSLATGEAVPVVRGPEVCIRAPLRGSTCAVPYDGDIRLALVHDLGRRASRNVYMHRFVKASERHNGITSYSEPFCFEGQQIEYACGLKPFSLGEEPGYLVSYGVEDREARVVHVSADTVEGLRWYLPTGVR